MTPASGPVQAFPVMSVCGHMDERHSWLGIQGGSDALLWWEPCAQRRPVHLAARLPSAGLVLWSEMEKVESRLAAALGLCQVDDWVGAGGADWGHC